MCYFWGEVCWLLLFCGFPAGCAGLPFKIISSANEPGENVIAWQFAVLSGLPFFILLGNFSEFSYRIKNHRRMRTRASGKYCFAIALGAAKQPSPS